MKPLSTLFALALALLAHGDALAQDHLAAHTHGGRSLDEPGETPAQVVIELRLMEAPDGTLQGVPPGPPVRTRVRDGGWGLGVRSLMPSLDLRLPLRSTTPGVRVLSAPRVVTRNHRPVRVRLPTVLRYTEASSQGLLHRELTTSLNIEVTPHLRRDRGLALGVVLSREEPGPIRRRAEVRARLDAGTTLAISGLDASGPAPADAPDPMSLRAVPLIGPLARDLNEPAPEQQLFVFITPRIVSAAD